MTKYCECGRVLGTGEKMCPPCNLTKHHNQLKNYGIVLALILAPLTTYFIFENWETLFNICSICSM